MGNEDRSAEVGAELVLRKSATGLSLVVQEIVVGVQELVTEIFPATAVNGVGSGLGAELDGAAGEMAVIGGEIVGVNLEFTEGILGGNERGEVDVGGVNRRAVDKCGALVGHAAADLVVAPSEGVGGIGVTSRLSLRNN